MEYIIINIFYFKYLERMLTLGNIVVKHFGKEYSTIIGKSDACFYENDTSEDVSLTVCYGLEQKELIAPIDFKGNAWNHRRYAITEKGKVLVAQYVTDCKISKDQEKILDFSSSSYTGKNGVFGILYIEKLNVCQTVSTNERKFYRKDFEDLLQRGFFVPSESDATVYVPSEKAKKLIPYL